MELLHFPLNKSEHKNNQSRWKENSQNESI